MTATSSAIAPAESRLRESAIALHQAGELEDAEARYRDALAASPDDPVLLHGYGVLCHQLGADEAALDLLIEAARLRPRNAEVLCHLGEALRAVNRLRDAETCFGHALDLRPDDPDTLHNLGHALLQQGRFADAERAYRAALRHLPRDPDLHAALGVALLQQHRAAEAAACYGHALELRPGDEEFAHLLAAVSGGTSLTAPRHYVETLFDRYAGSFEAHVTGELGYDAPTRLRSAIDALAPAVKGDPGLRIADLGCGTGLCGAAFADRARQLVGVDLSTRMLEQAAQRGIYDRLVPGDLATLLGPGAGPWDLVLAADVLIYVGALDEVFAGAVAALAPGGRLAFTTEHAEDATLVLRPSGRFAHGDRYVAALASAHGLEVEHVEPFASRRDRGVEIEGRIHVLRRITAPAAR